MRSPLCLLINHKMNWFLLPSSVKAQSQAGMSWLYSQLIQPPTHTPPPTRESFSQLYLRKYIVEHSRQPQYKLATQKLVWAWHSSTPACSHLFSPLNFQNWTYSSKVRWFLVGIKGSLHNQDQKKLGLLSLKPFPVFPLQKNELHALKHYQIISITP